MSELVFLRSKAYAYLVENKDVKKLNINYHKMFLLNSDKHEMFVKEVNKKSISPFDDKRWIYNDGIKTFPHGYDGLYFY